MGMLRQRPRWAAQQEGSSWERPGLRCPGQQRPARQAGRGSVGRPQQAVLPLLFISGGGEGQGSARRWMAGGQECQALDRPEDGDGTELGARGGRAAMLSPVGTTVAVGKGHHVGGALDGRGGEASRARRPTFCK